MCNDECVNDEGYVSIEGEDAAPGGLEPSAALPFSGDKRHGYLRR